ncbi:hypothetical protein BC940DRAFT_55291 [Gongronella butleri]|nr:hypothetical protein BC940DRAFT_55291 [Gongronella butleri]
MHQWPAIPMGREHSIHSQSTRSALVTQLLAPHLLVSMITRLFANITPPPYIPCPVSALPLFLNQLNTCSYQSPPFVSLHSCAVCKKKADSHVPNYGNFDKKETRPHEISSVDHMLAGSLSFPFPAECDNEVTRRNGPGVFHESNLSKHFFSPISNLTRIGLPTRAP